MDKLELSNFNPFLIVCISIDILTKLLDQEINNTETKKNINYDNPNSSNGNVTIAFAELIKISSIVA